MAAISDKLFADVKSHLNITWDDEQTNTRVKNLIVLGIAFLDDKCGEPVDYEVDGLPRLLLFEFVRYARDGATEVFEDNFLSLLNAMINDRKVTRNEENTLPCKQ